ncbi:arginyl-trna synthetase : Arginine--tRNA ligase OS=Singulisphaera acidiphila (strain ATCC BAA-1392 / DSM 18658 / VKM B-2454 / MOB10) GN=argS PE=3 SV=1: Arg_tRNA_synt_N: tRNA-synt_1d: DALR_1 [Gemmataceae bacterium]|nr:arginyl-trna synthetase : Arginine--tRNA ligase OS=Singulisphaera acidiphila (strain ATCC BAA-1392 / DSM 18658 / VKM B-2454 / MOB10) GN=argS PE=3 SV=1: Arg_tRNA_synt_N: tRNA-synt_1d: DALR_1 [Gemmataceae bacterium]VTT97333.1 arginyl-trna synthetase : Arginine--tRNA ligase OS=Singulisphaera acidiphila (strain ATCC BAA-1392 / DSM 18658 / VKM B-2454 / MOB10) GN=argS PE=3 SV=1: Arg_tRNA_synt_N: tRNA-synt_1d: DALR_1 [Gemmataceae bacterium]
MNVLHHLRSLFAPVLAEVAPDRAKVPDYLGMVKPSANAEHGDYQANFAMALGKALGQKPQDVAKAVVAKLPANDVFEPPTVAGPGFINLKLKDTWLAGRVRDLATDQKLGVEAVAKPKTFVIDLSGPNVAKPLHVGHLRSTIIGDSLVRILRFLGHTVVSDNHLGDWGLQFGILIHGYKNFRDDAAFQADPVRELARLYVAINKMFKKDGDDEDGPTDDPVKKVCQEETAKLHAGDPENLGLWQQFMPSCLEMLRPIYERLDVKIDHALGESFYNPLLPGVVEDMIAKGIAFDSKGAIVIPNAKGLVPRTEEEQKKEEPPAILRKRDGAFTYTTTDLATIKHRSVTWKPDAMLYVVGAPQALHFKTVFAQARRWGYDQSEFVHVQFGSMLGPDRKPFGARKGGVVELMDLLDDAGRLSLQKYEENTAARRAVGHKVLELTDAEKHEIGEVVGVGAVKYADLSQSRTTDYVFDLDKMTATDGNTAAYMQYAYARGRAIFREGEIDDSRFRTNPPPVVVSHPTERALALQLLRFPEVVEAAAAEYLPHLITAYLWDLAKCYSGFYVNCPVLKAESPELKDSRLLLVDLVGRVIKQALDLLGIRTVERM